MAAARIQTTKGLSFTFTLLCLVCLARSRFPKDELEEIKLKLKQLQQKRDSTKAEYKSIGPDLRLIDFYVNIMEQLEVMVMKSDLPEDFPSVDGLLQKTKDSVEKFKTDIGRKMEKLDAIIETQDEDFRNMKKVIEFLEESQAEL